MRWSDHPHIGKSGCTQTDLLAYHDGDGMYHVVATVSFYAPDYVVKFWRYARSNSTYEPEIRFTSLDEAKAYALVTYKFNRSNS